MIKPVVKATYKSNVAKVVADVKRQVGAFVEQAAQEGAMVARSRSRPQVATFVTAPQEQEGRVRVGVFVSREQFWATMFDKGTLGKRRVPLEQPGRRRAEWKVRRRGSEFVARRSAEALARGGITPQYFLIRGERHAEQRLEELVNAWVNSPAP